jgi:hypothetical protein
VATVEKRANARIFKDIGLGMRYGTTSYNNTKKKGNGGISTPHTLCRIGKSMDDD